MRGGLAIISVIFFFLLVSTVSAKDVELIRLQGGCDSDGNAIISMLHKGGAIRTTDIDITASHILTKNEKEIEGKWTVDGESGKLYLAGEYSEIVFKTIDEPFRSRGAYNIKFVFFQKIEDLHPTTVSVGINCPGTSCESDIDCNSDAVCLQEVCTALNCRADEYLEHQECVPKCNDHNPCTQDIYENGTCHYKRKEGECCTRDEDCDQGRACFTDQCVNNRCVEEKVVCESAATDKCVVAMCVEPKGCVYETSTNCLANENEKREYLIVVGEPKVRKKPFFDSFFEAIGSFFSRLF